MRKQSTSHSRTTKKQKLLEYEIAREKRRKEIKADYLASEKQWSELGVTLPLHTESLERFVDRNLKAWEEAQLRTPSGKYQDPGKLRATYHRRFVELIRTDYPHVLEELRNITPLFQKFSGSNGERFELLFDRQNLALFNLNLKFAQYVNVYGMTTPLFKYRPDRPRMFQHDFIWGEYRPMLLLLKLKSVARTELATPVLSQTIDCLREVSEIQRSLTSLEAEKVDAFLLDQILTTIMSFFDEKKCFHFFSMATNEFADYLKPVFEGRNIAVDLDSFVDVQLAVLDWARKYNLKKDWLLRYGLDFIKQFSENPALPAQRLIIRTPIVTTLTTPEFKFEFEEWTFDSEGVESYEARLRNAFDLRIKEYFDRCHRQLNLTHQKRSTSPRDFDRLKWLAYSTIEGLSKEGIQERIDVDSVDGNASPSLTTLYSAFSQFKALGLPVPA